MNHTMMTQQASLAGITTGPQKASKGKVLAIDDDSALCDFLETSLRHDGYQVITEQEIPPSLARLATEDFDLVLVDLHLGDEDGLQICRHVNQTRPDIPVIVVTGFGNLQASVAAIRAGAYDFVTKPLAIETLRIAVNRAIEHRQLHQELRRLRETRPILGSNWGILGESTAIKKTLDMVARVAPTDATVLISGESGTGKELVAKALHAASPERHKKPFVATNCAAVPESLMESELFGHVRGAFTDAKADRAGLFQQANGGTIFLDEVGEMALSLQPKLLRAIQERRIRPVGSSREIEFDVRIVAASNRDLEDEIEKGRFREDLYYRLNVVQITVPPLRARGTDILLLAQHFVTEKGTKFKKDINGFTDETAKKFLTYDWPGNVRELENTIERAVALARFDKITPEDLPERLQAYSADRLVVETLDPTTLPPLREVERRYIEKVLKATGGNKAHAARILGLDRRTLYRRMDENADD